MSQFETWFDGLVKDAMMAFAEDVAEDVRGTINHDCPQYHQHEGGHSPPGAPPYRETGRLLKSIKAEARVVTTGDVQSNVSTDVPYGATLEAGAHPFLKPAAQRGARVIAAKLASELVAKLPPGQHQP